MTAEEQAALRAEILQRVPQQTRDTRDPVSIAALVSDGRQIHVLAPIADIQAYLQTQGRWWVIKAAANDEAHPVHDAAEVVFDVASARYQNVDLSLPLVDQCFQQLASAGLMSEEDLTALRAMSQQDAPVSELDVRKACWSYEGEWLL